MEQNSKMLPISIVIAAVIIGGSMLYRSSGINPWAASADDAINAKPEKVLNYVTLAEELGLNTDAFQSCLASPVIAAEVRADYAEGNKLGVNGTPATFINDTLVSGAYPYEAYKEVIDAALTAGPKTSLVASIDDDAILGNADAPVTMVIFGDYQCPFCERAFADAEAKAREEYVATGKVRMVFRDYPLDFHPYAEPAAIAAECAGEQGKYWEYHDQLFLRQNELGPQ